MTLDEIRTAARSKSDEQSTGYIATSELDQFINQGYYFVFSKIVQRSENYFIVPGTPFSTVSGTQGYALPTNMVKLVRVEWRQSSSSSDNDWIPLRPTNIANKRFDERVPRIDDTSYGFSYFIAGNNIYLRPVPAQVFSIRTWHVVKPTDLSGASDEPTVPAIYHPLIAEYAALQCLAKSGESIYAERREAFEIELVNLLDTIDARDQQAEQMVITEDDDDYFMRGFNGF